MRFLQTEWHRHERDRNAWEIEKQEMKGRIATLEGQARRADSTQRALRKYVTILEKKVKEQTAQLKGNDETSQHEAEKPKVDRAALLQEKLRGQLVGAEGMDHFPVIDGLTWWFIISLDQGDDFGDRR
jgi:striatin 1/3/4